MLEIAIQGVFKVASTKLTPGASKAPTILYMLPNTRIKLRKAPFGLPLVAGNRIFTGTTFRLAAVESANRTPFVRVRTYLTRNFATLGPLCYGRPLPGASIHASGALTLS